MSATKPKDETATTQWGQIAAGNPGLGNLVAELRASGVLGSPERIQDTSKLGSSMEGLRFVAAPKPNRG